MRRSALSANFFISFFPWTKRLDTCRFTCAHTCSSGFKVRRIQRQVEQLQPALLAFDGGLTAEIMFSEKRRQCGPGQVP